MGIDGANDILKKNVTVKANQDGSADMHIYGIIGYDNTGEGTNNAAFALVSYIKSLADKFQRINIHINSPGGFIEDGMAIYNTIRMSTADIHTYNDGFVGSMAGIIYMAGKTRHAANASIHHIHQPATMTIGNIADHQNALSILEKWQELLVTILADNTGLSRDELLTRFFDGKDHMLSAEEANAININTVLDQPEPKAPVKNLNYSDIWNSFKIKPSILKRIFSVTDKLFDNNLNHSSMKTINLKNFLVVASLIETFNVAVGENDSVSISESQFLSLVNAVENLTKERDNLKTELLKSAESIAQVINDKEKLNATKKELEAKLDKPAPVAANTGATDNSTTKVDINSLDSITRNEILKNGGNL